MSSDVCAPPPNKPFHLTPPSLPSVAQAAAGERRRSAYNQGTLSILHPRSIGTALALALVLGVAGARVVSVASAQPVIRPARVGFLSPAGAAEYAAAADAFRQGLSDRGYVDNKNPSSNPRSSSW
jgi:hypothetical protein